MGKKSAENGFQVLTRDWVNDDVTNPQRCLGEGEFNDGSGGGHLFSLDRLGEGRNFRDIWRVTEGWVHGCIWNTKSQDMEVFFGYCQDKSDILKVAMYELPLERPWSRMLGKSAPKEFKEGENIAKKTGK